MVMLHLPFSSFTRFICLQIPLLSHYVLSLLGNFGGTGNKRDWRKGIITHVPQNTQAPLLFLGWNIVSYLLNIYFLLQKETASFWILWNILVKLYFATAWFWWNCNIPRFVFFKYLGHFCLRGLRSSYICPKFRTACAGYPQLKCYRKEIHLIPLCALLGILEAALLSPRSVIPMSRADSDWVPLLLHCEFLSLLSAKRSGLRSKKSN